MGTRVFANANFLAREDHPHAYGDKSKGINDRKAFWGSSPRVWGQVHKSIQMTNPSRIIPTRMGTSRRGLFCGFLNRDHPHAYGDKGCNSCGCNNI